jgi:hypothetical protein
MTLPSSIEEVPFGYFTNKDTFAWPYNTICCVIILISRIRPEKGEAALHFEFLWQYIREVDTTKVRHTILKLHPNEVIRRIGRNESFQSTTRWKTILRHTQATGSSDLTTMVDLRM